MRKIVYNYLQFPIFLDQEGETTLCSCDMCTDFDLKPNILLIEAKIWFPVWGVKDVAGPQINKSTPKNVSEKPEKSLKDLLLEKQSRP